MLRSTSQHNPLDRGKRTPNEKVTALSLRTVINSFACTARAYTQVVGLNPHAEQSLTPASVQGNAHALSASSSSQSQFHSCKHVASYRSSVTVIHNDQPMVLHISDKEDQWRCNAVEGTWRIAKRQNKKMGCAQRYD